MNGMPPNMEDLIKNLMGSMGGGEGGSGSADMGGMEQMMS